MPVTHTGSLIHEVQASRERVEVNTEGTEIDELHFGQLCREVVAEEPLVAEAVLLTEEGVHRRPRGGTGKDHPIVHVHAQGGLRGSVDTSEEGGSVKRRQDWGEG